MRVVGIDPGLDGAIAVVEDDRIVSIHSMPTSPLPLMKGTRREVDPVGLDALIPRDADLVVIERVWGDKGFGSSRSFTFGGAYYSAIAVVRLARLPLLRITAMEWKKLVLPDEDHSKQAAIDFVKQRYPGINLVRPGCREESHDWAESAILAHIGIGRLREPPEALAPTSAPVSVPRSKRPRKSTPRPKKRKT